MSLSRLCCATGAGLAIIVAGGCRDAAAEQRQEIQAAIVNASRTIGEVHPVRAGADDAASVRQELTRAVSELNVASSGVAGQKAAAEFLTAQARRQLAVGNIVEAQRLESTHRIKRHITDGRLNVAARLDTLAGNLESLDISQELSQLATSRRDAEEALRATSQRVAALDGPIAGLRSRNSSDAAQVERLRSDANDRRRDSTDLGAAAGIAAYEEAVALEREADRLEFDIAQRELQLAYEMEPQHAVASRQVVHLQDEIQAIDSSRRSLEEMVEQARAEASDARAQLGQFRQEIDTAIREIEEESSGALAELYEQAFRELDQAVAKARAAGSHDRQGEFGDAARLEQARASLDAGDLHAARALGINNHLALLERVSGVPSLGNLSAASPRELGAARDQALQQAIGAYGEAKTTLGQVKYRGLQRELAALVATLERAEAMLSGTAPPQVQAPSTRRREAPPAGGADSPREIVAALNQFASSGASGGIVPLFDLIYPEFDSPQEREAFNFMKDQASVMESLDKAMQTTFGKGFDDLGQSMGGGMTGGMGGLSNMEAMGKPTSARLGDVVGDRGEVLVTLDDGSSETVEILKVGGRWFMALPEELKMSPDEAAMMQMAMPMVRQMMDRFRSYTDRINAGEFATIDEFAAAMTADMEGMFQQMMGGQGMRSPGQ